MDKNEEREHINGAIWLRYEAFSNLATHINRCKTFEEVSKALHTYGKFVFESSGWRIILKSKNDYLVFMQTDNKLRCTINKRNSVFPAEKKWMVEKIPKKLSRNCLSQYPDFNELWPKDETVAELFVLPQHLFNGHDAVTSVASSSGFTKIDYKFIKLCSEIVITKASQMLLNRALERKSVALQSANQELTSLNHEINMINCNLEEMVRLRSSKLLETQRELSTLFYRTSHDFRRPLASILGLANLIELAEDKTEILPLLTHLRKSVKDITIMLEKFQLLSLVDVEHSLLKKIDFSEVAQKLKAKYQDLCEAERIKLTFKVQPIKNYYSYEVVVVTIMENLLDNAVKYHNRQNPKVQVEVGYQEEMLGFYIRDNGEGIREKHQDSIFNMYSRASERSTGNGLGLYVTKKLLESLGGVITFESKPYEETIFKVFIPNMYKTYKKNLEKLSMVGAVE